MNDESLRYWLGFNHTKGIGPIRFRALLQHFGDAKTAWNAPARALREAGLDGRTLQSLLKTRATVDLDAELRAVARANAWIVTLEDEAYPELLRTLTDAPPLLYV